MFTAKYAMNEDDLRGFIQFIGAETKDKGNEVVFRYCPKCRGSAPKEDEWKFSVNRKTGAFGCFRGSCGYHGHFIELCRDFGYRVQTDEDRDFVDMPQPTHRIIPRESALAYLLSRGIGKETAEKYQVTAFEDKPNILWMPLFDEYGKLVGAKLRKMDYRKGRDKNKEWFTADSKPILFGMNTCSSFDTLIITEGQMDAMSVSEAGFPNAVSVPNGMNGFSWVSYCYDWMMKFKELVVFGDLERGKVSLVDQIALRVPMRIRVVQKEDYLGEKDANDILRAFGVDAVRRAVEGAKEKEISHVKDLADVQYRDLSLLPKIRTGIFDLDRALKGGICFGQVLLLTGNRGEGKSTFASNIFADALDQGYGCFAYSGELPNFHFKSWLNSQLAGNSHMKRRVNEFDEEEWYLDEETDRKISDWYRGRAFIYDQELVAESPDSELDTLTDTIRKTIAQKDVKLILIDNLMTAMDAVETTDGLYMAQGKFVNELKQIAIRYDVAIILIAHPRKAGKDEPNAFDNDRVSGSSDITNRVDIILSYGRSKENEDGDSRLQISKNRLAGTLKLGNDSILLNYSQKTKRVFGVRTLDKHYGWEKVQPVQVDMIDVPF